MVAVSSADLREHVVAAIDARAWRRETAWRFEINRAGPVRWRANLVQNRRGQADLTS